MESTGYERLLRCPASYMTPELHDVLGDYVFAREGAFPEGEGTLEQAPAALQTFRVFHAESARVAKEEADEVEAARPKQ